MELVLFFNLLCAHLIADFWLQTNKMVFEKRRFGFQGKALYIHSLTVALISYLFSGTLLFWPYAIVIFLSHVIIDFLKTRFKVKLWPFVVDQILHFVIAYCIAVWFIQNNTGWTQFAFISEQNILKVPILICACIFCTSPANFFIREVLAKFRINTLMKKKEGTNDKVAVRLRNAGALIGGLERLLVLAFVLIGNYEAAGLTIAAKTILRFRDDEGPRTEFVLVGTLLSFLIVLIVSIIVLLVAFDGLHLK